ncbi:RloB family protein [uncultured Alistipes sp.]|uniref:RloB family protein n=1 Tax=uncultured Alistipes sp. TaxID=538949 RepID=UPI0026207E3B|nr:RloB family protein [uncultured Alistipes sp.]
MARKIKIDNAILKRQKHKTTKRHILKKISCRILIICEGEKTEPNYFRRFRAGENNSFVYEVECDGKGNNTIDVVDDAIRRRDAAEKTIPYDSVWAVFDRDSFPKDRFNNAIAKAQANGIEVAWSNEAFELWYLYHFHNRTTPMSREDYADAISNAVNTSQKWNQNKPYKYAKNAPKNYDTMIKYGNLEQAIEWAKRQHLSFNGDKYADHNPCTLVYKLVLQLLDRDQVLINQVMDKINKSSTDSN